MDSRGSLDLAPEIMCLVDVHFPRSSQWHNHILLQAENLVWLDEWVFPVDQSVSPRRLYDSMLQLTRREPSFRPWRP